eukprot:m.163179 g.163179  ORF g.163179 m.163179 type:complete len:238 (+) comp15213_c1_seq3:3673-4386(+)
MRHLHDVYTWGVSSKTRNKKIHTYNGNPTNMELKDAVRAAYPKVSDAEFQEVWQAMERELGGNAEFGIHVMAAAKIFNQVDLTQMTAEGPSPIRAEEVMELIIACADKEDRSILREIFMRIKEIAQRERRRRGTPNPDNVTPNDILAVSSNDEKLHTFRDLYKEKFEILKASHNQMQAKPLKNITIAPPKMSPAAATVHAIATILGEINISKNIVSAPQTRMNAGPFWNHLQRMSLS